MKNKILLFLFALNTWILSAQEDLSSFSLALNQDNAFGFAPAIFGTMDIKGDVDLTYYGIFWTNPAYANAGQDNWLETGIGLSVFTLEEQLLINPSLGFTHGSLLSNTNTGNAAEGIVPSIAAFLLTEKFETEFYCSYYKALRKGGSNASDFVLYWLYPGYVINDRFSAGAHYEQFYLTQDSTGASGSFYQWLGAYAKFTSKSKYSFRFSMGRNLNDNGLYARDFYKLAVLLPLP